MMLAAVPGTVGDGGPVTLDYRCWRHRAPDDLLARSRPADTSSASWSGRWIARSPGLCETPDGKALFVDVQHPGEDAAFSDIGDPTKYSSHWPGNAGYGAGGDARPRSATVMVVKDDGGRIGT